MLRYIKILDGLRGFAALFIVLAHYPQVTESAFGKNFKTLVEFLKFGYLGVDIFFVLSGFLITRILLHEKRRNKLSLEGFYYKRALRIFPIYYLAIFICWVLFDIDGVAYLLSYVSNFYFSFELGAHPLRHFWSLAIEEQFYLFWPLMIFLMAENTFQKVIVFFIPSIVVVFTIFIYNFFPLQQANDLMVKATFIRILSLGVGGYLATIEQKILKVDLKRTILFLLLCLVSYSSALLIHKTILVDYLPKTLIHIYLFTVTSTTLFIFLIQFEDRENIVKRFFMIKPVRFLGKISYGIYVYHYPILYFFGLSGHGSEDKVISLMEAIGIFLLIIFVAISSYYFIEKPFLNMKKKYVTSKM